MGKESTTAPVGAASPEGAQGDATEPEKPIDALPAVISADKKTVDPWTDPVRLNPAMLPPAVRSLPKDAFGYVDWSASYRDGFVNPRWNLTESEVGKDPEEFDRYEERVRRKFEQAVEDTDG